MPASGGESEQKKARRQHGDDYQQRVENALEVLRAQEQKPSAERLSIKKIATQFRIAPATLHRRKTGATARNKTGPPPALDEDQKLQLAERVQEAANGGEPMTKEALRQEAKRLAEEQGRHFRCEDGAPRDGWLRRWMREYGFVMDVMGRILPKPSSRGESPAAKRRRLQRDTVLPFSNAWFPSALPWSWQLHGPAPGGADSSQQGAAAGPDSSNNPSSLFGETNLTDPGIMVGLNALTGMASAGGAAAAFLSGTPPMSTDLSTVSDLSRSQLEAVVQHQAWMLQALSAQLVPMGGGASSGHPDDAMATLLHQYASASAGGSAVPTSASSASMAGGTAAEGDSAARAREGPTHAESADGSRSHAGSAPEAASANTTHDPVDP